MHRKRLLATFGIAVVTGIGLSLVAVVGSAAVVVLRGASQRVPGLVDYVQTDRLVSVSTDRDLWVLVLVLSVLSLPLSWYAAGRHHPRTLPPAQVPAVVPDEPVERPVEAGDSPRRRSSSPASS